MATSEELKDIIVDIIKDPDLKQSMITEQTQLIGENGLFYDSIDVLELLVQIEKKYGIKINDNSIIEQHFTTFDNFFKFVKENEK